VAMQGLVHASTLGGRGQTRGQWIARPAQGSQHTTPHSPLQARRQPTGPELHVGRVRFPDLVLSRRLHADGCVAHASLIGFAEFAFIRQPPCHMFASSTVSSRAGITMFAPCKVWADLVA
jgi:hypothetical protein